MNNIARRQHCCTEDGSKCWSSGIYNSGSSNTYRNRSSRSMSSISAMDHGITFQSQSNFYFSSYCWFCRFSLCCHESFIKL